MSLADRAMGTLWGLAYGDVLGAPIEMWTADEIRTVFGAYADVPALYPPTVPKDRRARLRPLGAHTDDTQQALSLVSVCLAGWSRNAWAKCLVEGARVKAWRGTGRHFDNAVAKLAKGEAPDQAGSPSAGIGAAMRIAPLGALCRDQSRKLAEVTLESSAMTHADIRSITLAYGVAWASAHLVNGKDVMDVRKELPDAVAEGEDEWLHGRQTWNIDRAPRHQMSLNLARCLARMPEDVRGLAPVVVEIGAPHFAPPPNVQPALPLSQAQAPPVPHANHGFALLGGLFGLCAALVRDVDPREALAEIVRLGEDTDTVAAIAGGVLGARFGTAWVPKERLTDRANLEKYAHALVHRVSAPEATDALLAREAEYTAREKSFSAF